MAFSLVNPGQNGLLGLFCQNFLLVFLLHFHFVGKKPEIEVHRLEILVLFDKYKTDIKRVAALRKAYGIEDEDKMIYPGLKPNEVPVGTVKPEETLIAEHGIR